jgi:hypothetical protein
LLIAIADRFHSAAIHALRHVRRRLGRRLAKLEPSEVETIRDAAELMERALAE